MTKKRFIKVLGLLLVVGLLFAALPNGTAQAATLCVNPGGTDGCYASIQDAINAASAGDTINVAAGNYVGTVEINKANLSLIATGGADVTTIDANGAMVGIGFGSFDNLGTITINGFTVTNFTDLGIAQSMWRPNFVVHVLNNKVIATNNFLRNGINIAGSGSTIIGNTIVGATYNSPDYGSSAIIAVNGLNILIENNTISGTPDYGITVNNYNRSTPMTGTIVRNNTIDGADYGVVLSAAATFSIDGVTLTGNAITNSSAPVALEGSVINVFDLPPVHNTTQGTFYYTIQAAITAATNGDTIELPAGTYVEDVVVTDKYFNLIGAVDTNGDPISVLEGSLFINNPTYGNPPEFTTLKNIYFERTDSHLLNLKNFNGGLIENCVFDGNNGFLDYQFNGINLEGSTPNGNSNITVLNSTFKDGLYVGIGGYADGLTVQTSDFTNVKSGINLQGGGGNLVVTGSTFLTKPVSDGDSYGIRFASSSGSTPNLTVTGSTFTIDDRLGFDPTPTNYHSTIIIRAGATGTINISGNTINNELVGLATVADLDAIYAANDFPFGYGVYGTKITAAPTKVNMSPATITGNCDAEYVAYVNVTAAPDTTGYRMVVNFNPAMVEVTKVENGTFLTGEVTAGLDDIIDNANGRLVFERIKFATGGINVPDYGDGSLIKITFTPKAAGVSSFTIDGTDSYLMDWPDAFPYPYEITGDASVDLDGVVKNTFTEVEYCSLASAVLDAVSGEGLQLLADITIPTTVTVDKALTLDLNGKVATASTGINALNVTTGGALNITDSGTTGKITGGTRAVMVNGGGSLTLTNGWLDGTGFDGVFVYGEGSSVTVNGGKITGLYYGISGNGSAAPSEYYGSTNILITGGTVQGGETAIFHPELGLLKITGGTITGGSYNGIEMKAGDLIITGGTITATGLFEDEPAQTSNGNTQTGDAILIYNRAGYLSTMTVDISGGTITSTHGYALREFTYDGEVSRTTAIDISGGTFTGGLGVDNAGAAVTFMTVAPEILKITDGRYNYDPDEFVYAPYGSYYAAPWWQIMDLTGTIAWDPGQTGQVVGEAPLSVVVAGNVIDFTGKIEWYPTAPGRTEGNRVGVQVTAPAGFPTAGTTFTFAGATYNWDDVNDGDNFVWIYPKVTTVPQSWDIVVTWKTGVTQTFTVNVKDTSTLNTPPAPTITSTDVFGPYIPGVPREFTFNVSNAGGADYALATFDYQIVGVSKADIASFEYKNELGNWIAMGSRPQETYLDCTVGGVASICGQFGWAPDGFGPFPTDFAGVSQFRVKFLNGKVDPLPLTLTLKGKKLGTETDWTVLQTFTANIEVYENVQITGTAPVYYLVGDAGESTITITNPDGGAPYGNHIEFNLTILGAVKADIQSATCTYGPVTLDILGMLSEVGGNLTGTLFPADGAFTVDAPYDREISCTMVFNTAKDYTSTSEMKYVVGSDKYTVATNTATAHVYTKPVITSLDLPGTFQQGVAKAITIDVNNVGLMDDPNNFTLHLGLPDGTVVTYLGVDYTCTTGGCDIPVTLVEGANALPLTVTFMASSTADVTISLVDPDIDPGRVLATITGPNVVHANVALVTGTVTMQGRRTYNYAKFTLTGTFLGYGPYPSTTSDAAGAFSFTNIIADEYTITTDMPRYLNIYCNVDPLDQIPDLCKKITLSGNDALNTLWLRAGNANWTGGDNIIDGLDASQVGSNWGGAGSTDLTINHGDVNFDNIVNIQDLALVGGNMDLTSAQAYGTTWVP